MSLRTGRRVWRGRWDNRVERKRTFRTRVTEQSGKGEEVRITIPGPFRVLKPELFLIFSTALWCWCFWTSGPRTLSDRTCFRSFFKRPLHNATRIISHGRTLDCYVMYSIVVVKTIFVLRCVYVFVWYKGTGRYRIENDFSSCPLDSADFQHDVLSGPCTGGLVFDGTHNSIATIAEFCIRRRDWTGNGRRFSFKIVRLPQSAVYAVDIILIGHRYCRTYISHCMYDENTHLYDECIVYST